MFHSLKKTIKSSLIPVCLPIRSGPLAGMKWSITSGVRFLRGEYSQPEIAFYSEQINEGDCVLDIGAHVGYMAALYSQLVGTKGQVYAFEPNPLNVKAIKHHLCINGLCNIKFLEYGIGEHCKQDSFDDSPGSGRGRICDRGDVTINTTSVDHLHESGQIPKAQFIKMDIEGGEIGALQGAKNYLSRYRPTMLISTHGRKAHRFSLDFLKDIGYQTQMFGKSTNRVIATK